ncbi:MAG: hypothetical protein QM831_46610 [Kofleriaceae bacterium]
MRTLVIGGRGFLGRRVVAALRERGVEPTASGRELDIAQITPAQLAPYEVVINCSDTLVAPPDQLHLAARAAGVIYLETTSEPRAYRRLLDQHTLGDGIAILGAGLFPGISNLVAHAAFTANGCRGPVSLAIRFSPFTAAGKGMVALIAFLLREPPIDGSRPFQPGPAMHFRDGMHPTVHAAMPEAHLLAHSLDTKVTALLSPTPNLLQPLLRFVPAWLARVGVGFLRRFIFRNRPTRVEIAATAGDQTIHYVADDGVMAGARAIADLASRIFRHRVTAGTYTVDQILTLEEVRRSAA